MHVMQHILWNTGMSIIRQSFIINNYLYTNEKVVLLDIPVYFWNSFVFSVLFFSIILIPRLKKKYSRFLTNYQ